MNLKNIFKKDETKFSMDKKDFLKIIKYFKTQYGIKHMKIGKTYDECTGRLNFEGLRVIEDTNETIVAIAYECEKCDYFPIRTIEIDNKGKIVKNESTWDTKAGGGLR